jgi:uncharacterized membrane protein YoaK (UPF0700 family)
MLHGQRQPTRQAVKHHAAAQLSQATTGQSALQTRHDHPVSHHKQPGGPERTTAAMTVQLKPSARQATTVQTAVSFWTAARTSNELCGPVPAAVLKPDILGTSTTGLVARRPFFSRLPLKAGVGAITAICGMLDAATFLGLGHVFAETMNGNIVLLAFTVGTHGIHGFTSFRPADVLPYAVVLVCFAAGAAFGGRLIRRDGEAGRRIGFAGDAGLIGVAAVVVALTHPGPAGQARYLVIGILAVAMGMQNVLIRQWGIADLATNAMTKTMAYLVADSALGGGDNHHAMRRGVSIVIFAVGVAAGAFLTRYGVLWPILTAFTLFVLALPILLQPPKL